MPTLTTELVATAVGSVEVRRGGGGPPLVYLHSATGEGEGLAFLDALADHFTVIAPMFPGFGASQGVEQIDDIEDAAFHLRDLFDRLDLADPFVVGLSLGGWLALELLTRWPERASDLVLVNPVGLYLEGAPIKDIFGRSPGQMADDLFANQDHPMAQMMHAMDELRNDMALTTEIPFELVRPVMQTMAATARLGWDPYLHNPKLLRRLSLVTCPTLVVRGAKDTLVPAAHAEYFADHLPHARLHVIDDAAHLVPLEKPDELAAVITDFFTH
jgi:pimeloyl-ACP methyl ester carboxylesterase